ncbi:Rne/Rng family ribonuclease [Lentisphaerota bacterium ZTH]|nr:Rne/Rng family ribonuclease [Lentisphaerota bacterium]WET06411.1 Rne/Rng family ribonuclease [Lentisphaerota bacterium ZTH]
MENKKKKIILNCEKLEARCAIVNNSKLEEYQIERTYEGPKVGSVYLGKIVNLEPALHAAFVNIGANKNAFLHYWDMIPASYELQDKISDKEKVTQENKKSSSFSQKLRSMLTQGDKAKKIREQENKLRRRKITTKDIPSLFPPGTELLVQVVKEPIGTKGARLTTNISIPGRYLVLLPYSDHIGLSSKIDNAQERNRIKKILASLDVPEGMGLICRTVGEGRKAIFFKRDLDMLLDYWHQVEESLEKHKVPSVVYTEPTLIERTVRDFMTEDIDEIIVDNSKAFNKIYKSLRKFGGMRMAAKVIQYNRAQPVFEHFKVKEQLDMIFGRQVPLPSGGYICIDETEALIAIDVNTGKGKRSGDHPEVIVQTNMEAAEEVARQLRLRNIGGLVVIDFIDMRSARDREKIFKLMRKLVKDDRAKSKILPLSKLGLMEMTRQREHESLQATIFDNCPYCGGSGHIKSPLTMSVEIQRRLRSVLKSRHQKKIAIRVFMHPEILARLKNEDAELLNEMEEAFGRDLSFRADSTLHHEEFRLVDPVTGAELK